MELKQEQRMTESIVAEMVRCHDNACFAKKNQQHSLGES